MEKFKVKAVKLDKVKVNLGAPIQYAYRHKNGEKFQSKPYRSEFIRDRDRILYSVEFRRLSGKTQVFLATSDDQIRTRLTHTLEVSQISGITAEKLGIRKDLCEAIALGHDVGHTPFGHAGEKTLNFLMNGCDIVSEFQQAFKKNQKGFKHNLQSLRVLNDLERMYGKVGLNLTNFTLWGIKNHTKTRYDQCGYHHNSKCYLGRYHNSCRKKTKLSVEFYERYKNCTKLKDHSNHAWSFEGQVVMMADEIAQRHHDIVDSLLMGIITPDELNSAFDEFSGEYFDFEDKKIFEKLKEYEDKKDKDMYLPFISKFVVHFLNKNLIKHSIKNLNGFISEHGIKRSRDFCNEYPNITAEDTSNIIAYPPSFKEKEKKLHDFLKNRIINSFQVQRMDGKGGYVIRRLFKAFLSNPKQLHDPTIVFIFRLYEDWSDTWKEIKPKMLGKFREKIDSSSLNSEKEFQVSLLRGICDHVAGMTDRFAMLEYEKLYGNSR